MKQNLFAALLAVLMILPTGAMAIDLTDYKDTDLQYQDAELAGRFDLRDGNQDQISYAGRLQMEYEMEYSTLPFKWDAYAIGDFDFSRGPNDGDDSEKNFQATGWTSAKKYFDEHDGLFGFGRIALGLRDLESTDDDDPYAKVTFGAGYGRIITATPLMEAIRCLNDLTEYGIVAGSISDKLYLDLAAIIAKENEYKSKHGLRDYERYWYEDMEKLLKNAGVLQSGVLGAMGIIRIQDILTDEPVLRRKHGWEAGVGVDYLISDYAGNDGDPGLSAFFEYAKPYGLKWQFINRLEYSTVLVDWEFGDAAHKIANVMELNYEMTDKIDWENRYELDIILETEGDVDDTYLNILDTGLRYYISNTIDAKTGLTFSHKDQGDNDDDDLETRFYFEILYTLF